MKNFLRILAAAVLSTGWIWMAPVQANSASPTPVSPRGGQSESKQESKKDEVQPEIKPSSKSEVKEPTIMPSAKVEAKQPEVKSSDRPNTKPNVSQATKAPKVKVEDNQPQVKSSSKPSTNQPTAKPNAKLSESQQPKTTGHKIRDKEIEVVVAKKSKRTEKEVAALISKIIESEIKASEVSFAQVTEIGEMLGALTSEAEQDIAENLGIAPKEIAKIANEMRSNPALAKAFIEFEQRKSKSEETEFAYTLADATSEVQVEQFLQDPLGTIFKANPIKFLSNFSELGKDMTDDQRKKVQEIAVPLVIIQTCISLVRMR